MPQQINLFPLANSASKVSFSAQNMLKVFALLVLLGGGLSAYWVWSLHQASEDLKKYLAIQLPEFDRLKLASALSNAASGQVRLSLTQELQMR